MIPARYCAGASSCFLKVAAGKNCGDFLIISNRGFELFLKILLPSIQEHLPGLEIIFTCMMVMEIALVFSRGLRWLAKE